MWKTNKYINILLWVLAIVSVGLCVYVFIKSGQLDAGEQEELLKVIDPMFLWSYILVAATALLAIFFFVLQVIKNPKSAIGILVVILGFGAIAGLSYVFAKSDSLPFTPGHEPVSEFTIKFADINLIFVYIMLLATLLVTIGTSIWNVFKLR